MFSKGPMYRQVQFSCTHEWKGHKFVAVGEWMKAGREPVVYEVEQIRLRKVVWRMRIHGTVWL